MSVYPVPQQSPQATQEPPAAHLSQADAQNAIARTHVSRIQRLGRVILIWVVAYASLRFWSHVLPTLAQASLVTVLWLAVSHRVAQAFRSMTFAVGAVSVAASSSVGAAGLIAIIGFWVPEFEIKRTPLAVATLSVFAAAAVWDVIARRTTRPPARVLIAGGGNPAARLLDDLERDPSARIEVIGIVDDVRDEALAQRVPYAGKLGSLSETVRRLSPDVVVVAVPRGRPQVFAQLLAAADAGFQVVGLPEVYEFVFGRLPVQELTSAWFMSVLHAYNRPSNRLLKRSFDVVVALVGLVVALPLIPVIVLVVARTEGPLLYRQQRLGEHGKLFWMLKFRSMRTDAEASGEARWAATNDPRVIPGGRLLRLLRFDELPQLWNVLRGEMSIVGPRPERPEFIAHLEAEVPFWTQRHLLKPGITGWAQIRAGYAADALGTVEKLSYDLWYLRHRSVLLDSIICMKTLPRMLTFRGAR